MKVIQCVDYEKNIHREDLVSIKIKLELEIMELKIKLLVEKDINEYVYHWSESYSGLKIDTKDKITEKCNLFKSLFKTKFGTQWYSVKKQGKIIGGFRVFDQWINVHKKEVKFKL